MGIGGNPPKNKLLFKPVKPPIKLWLCQEELIEELGYNKDIKDGDFVNSTLHEDMFIGFICAKLMGIL